MNTKLKTWVLCTAGMGGFAFVAARSTQPEANEGSRAAMFGPASAAQAVGPVRVMQNVSCPTPTPTPPPK